MWAPAQEAGWGGSRGLGRPEGISVTEDSLEKRFQSDTSHPRVLIVDDDEGILRLLSSFLEGKGFRVVQCRSLWEAREQISQSLPELILLDYQLPDGVGTQLLKELGERSMLCSVVMMTGVARDDVSTATEAMRLGAADYLTKPFSLTALENKVNSSLAERELRRRSREELLRKRAFSRQILLAVEKERQRLSAELHDEIGQALTTLKIQAELLLEEFQGSPEQAQKLMGFSQGLSEAIEKLREIAQGLRPPVLDKLGLEAAITRLLEECQGKGRMNVRYFFRGLESRLSPELELGVYRIVQEAVTNVLKHAQAGQLSGKRHSPQSISITIEDDGAGFLSSGELTSAGVGLLTMRERAESLGGSLWVESVVGSGTCVSAELPLAWMGDDSHGFSGRT